MPTAHRPSRHQPDTHAPDTHEPPVNLSAPAFGQGEVLIFPRSYFPDDYNLIPGISETRLTSPINGSTQRVRQPGGAGWTLEMRFTNRKGGERADLMAFFTKLRIGNHAFMIHIPEPRRGEHQGSDTIIATSSQWGNVLQVYNAGVTAVHSQFRHGDYLSINSSELKMVMGDVQANGTSKVSCLQIWPPIRTIPDSGAMVYGAYVNSLMGAFRLTSIVDFNVRPPNYETDFVVRAIEHVNSTPLVDYA